MRLYFDICALKRPWDDQRSPRIAMETLAMIELVQLTDLGVHEAVRSPMQDEENARNSNPARAESIAKWLARLPEVTEWPATLERMIMAARNVGLGEFDTLHLPWAEALRATLLVTTDDAFIRRTARQKNLFRVRVVNPLAALHEVQDE